MYSQQLDSLIRSVVADGTISDKERAVLHKRAAQEGVDPDELDVYIDGLLQHSAPAAGPVVPQPSPIMPPTPPKQIKCNHCGAILSSFQAVCPECGCEISTNRSNTSISELFTKLDEEERSYAQEVARQGSRDRAQLIRLERAHYQRHCSIISNFPVPNETEALMEFLSMGVSHAKGAMRATTSMKGFVIATLLEIIGALLLIPVTMSMVQQCADNKYSHPNVARYEGGKDKQDAMIFIVLILVGAIAFTWYLYQKKKEGDKQYTNQNQYDISVAEAWRQKCRQVLVKARLTLSDDPEKMAMLNDFEKQL